VTTIGDLLRSVGFTGAGLSTAEGVAAAESGDNARAHNGNAATGDNSYGLFQINMLGSMGPARLKQYGLTSNDQLFDPATNARVAYQMSQGGTNWSPWSTFKSGAYRAHAGDGSAQITSSGAAVPLSSSGGLGAGGIGTTALNAATGQPAGLSIPNPFNIATAAGTTAVQAGTVLLALAAGGALLLLGLNKTAGNPAGKAAGAMPSVVPIPV
jgi:hypothetical protein